MAYALNANGNPARNVISLNLIPAKHAVKIGQHIFDERTLATFFEKTNNPRNPITRQSFPNAIAQRFRRQISRRKANAMTERNRLAERRRLMLAFNNVLNELRNATGPKYLRTLSSRSRVRRAPSFR
jgi:hypothetical protein